ncbi:3-ketoacyl-CoA thiolase [Clavulina sp. PMI_390]|nr:3-ketoacyl-CoA thiolase [Clavulina sp. PMI_390]
MERIKQLASHLTSPTSGVAALEVKRPDDVVITMAVRSPLGRQKKGAFKDTQPDELLTAFLKAAIAKSTVDPAQVQDLVFGNTLHQGAAYVVRASMLAAGFPHTTPFQVVNRFCSSGLMAVNSVATRIRAGEIEIGMAGGFENMSTTPDNGAPQITEEVKSCKESADSLQPMGWTSENVAGDFKISRQEMDEFAYLSHTRASKADTTGLFEAEILPVEINKKDPTTGAVSKITVSKDDVIRHGTELPTLLKIRSAFPQWAPSQTTGGNASQNSDGVALVLLMRRDKAEQLGLKILAKYIATSVVGVPPRIMGVGPLYAIPAVLRHVGLTKEDIDLFEINEAFASMYVYCVKTLGLDINKVNIIATGLAELERRKGKVLVTSMCMGTGMGAAAVFVRES